MERKRGKFVIGPCEFQAASMADLAFLLLIFFIVTTVFAVEEGIPLLLPGRTTEAARLKRSDVLEIRAYRDGSIEADGRRVDIGAVRPLVQGRIASDPDVVVVLVTAPDAAYGLMVAILDEVKLARCRRISLKAMD
jgi:biopolymer transport protein ExbD